MYEVITPKQGACTIECQPPDEAMVAKFSFPEFQLGPGVSARHGLITPFLRSKRSDARYPESIPYSVHKADLAAHHLLDITGGSMYVPK